MTAERRAVLTARDATLALLATRAPDATICPSEVARALTARVDADAAATAWRSMMPVVHAAIDELVDEGVVQLSWKRKTLAGRAGPYRIGRGGRAER